MRLLYPFFANTQVSERW